jgi:carbon monoxide dehydrogenase subunit G
MKLDVRRSFSTTASPEAAFAFLADFRNAESWDPGTERCERLTGDGGPATTYRNVSTFLGRTTELTYVTVTHEPPARLHFQGRNKSFVGDDRLGFVPDGAGTRVDYHATFWLRGAAQLTIPVVAAYLPRLASRTIQQLRSTLDSLPA